MKNLIRKDPQSGKFPFIKFEQQRWSVRSDWDGIGSVHGAVGSTLEHVIEMWNEFVDWDVECRKEEGRL